MVDDHSNNDLRRDITPIPDGSVSVRITFNDGSGLVSNLGKLVISKDYLDIGFFPQRLRKKHIKNIREAGIFCYLPRISFLQRALKISIGHSIVSIWPSIRLGKSVSDYLELYGYTIERYDPLSKE